MFAVFLLALPTITSIHAEEKTPEKAVIATSEKDGMKLSDAALKTIEVKTEKISSTEGSFQVPISSLVYSLDRIGIYRQRSQWIKFIPVEILKKHNPSTIKTTDLQSGDLIIVQGVPLVRAAEMEAFQGEEE